MTAPDRLLAFDLETSGLDARRDAIVAAGAVPLVGRAILWGRSWGVLIDDPRHARPRDLGALAVHQVLPEERHAGLGLGELLDRVGTAVARGWVLLVHGASIERSFLAAAAGAAGRPAPAVPTLDTLGYLRSIDRFRDHLVDRLPPAVRRAGELPTALAPARALFGLPRYTEHDPRLDALATAELYLMLSARFPELHPDVKP